MTPTLHAGRHLGTYTVTDGAGLTLFTLRTATTGAPRLYWDNPSTGMGGEGMHLTAAVVAGLMSTGMSYPEAHDAGYRAVREYLGDYESDGEPPDVQVWTRKLSTGVRTYRWVPAAELDAYLADIDADPDRETCPGH